LKSQVNAIQEEDVAFIKEQTGIADPDALKKHVIDVQKKAYAVGF
jgi:hypothetical protein